MNNLNSERFDELWEFWSSSINSCFKQKNNGELCVELIQWNSKKLYLLISVKSPLITDSICIIIMKNISNHVLNKAFFPQPHKILTQQLNPQRIILCRRRYSGTFIFAFQSKAQCRLSEKFSVSCLELVCSRFHVIQRKNEATNKKISVSFCRNVKNVEEAAMVGQPAYLKIRGVNVKVKTANKIAAKTQLTSL